MNQHQQNAPAATGLQHPQQPMPNRDQLEALRLENAELRSNVSEMVKKIGKVNTLEQEMAKIHQAYQALLKHSEKREALEKSARAKLQSVIVNLSEANKEVTERHEAVMAQLMSGEPKNQNIPGTLASNNYFHDSLVASKATPDSVFASYLGWSPYFFPPGKFATGFSKSEKRVIETCRFGRHPSW